MPNMDELCQKAGTKRKVAFDDDLGVPARKRVPVLQSTLNSPESFSDTVDHDCLLPTKPSGSGYRCSQEPRQSACFGALAASHAARHQTPPAISQEDDSSNRTVLPPRRHPRDVFGYSQKPRVDLAPFSRLKHRLQRSETPIVDRLYSAFNQLAYFDRYRAVDMILRKLGDRAKKPGWQETFVLRENGRGERAHSPKERPGTKQQRKSKARRYDFTRPVLRKKLLSAFGHLPFDAVDTRTRAEKILVPLIVVNRRAFPELEGCNFWKDWTNHTTERFE